MASRAIAAAREELALSPFPSPRPSAYSSVEQAIADAKEELALQTPSPRTLNRTLNEDRVLTSAMFQRVASRQQVALRSSPALTLQQASSPCDGQMRLEELKPPAPLCGSRTSEHSASSSRRGIVPALQLPTSGGSTNDTSRPGPLPTQHTGAAASFAMVSVMMAANPPGETARSLRLSRRSCDPTSPVEPNAVTPADLGAMLALSALTPRTPSRHTPCTPRRDSSNLAGQEGTQQLQKDLQHRLAALRVEAVGRSSQIAALHAKLQPTRPSDESVMRNESVQLALLQQQLCGVSELVAALKQMTLKQIAATEVSPVGVVAVVGKDCEHSAAAVVADATVAAAVVVDVVVAAAVVSDATVAAAAVADAVVTDAVVADTAVADAVVTDAVVADAAVADVVVADAMVADAVVADAVVADAAVAGTAVADAVVADAVVVDAVVVDAVVADAVVADAVVADAVVADVVVVTGSKAPVAASQGDPPDLSSQTAATTTVQASSSPLHTAALLKPKKKRIKITGGVKYTIKAMDADGDGVLDQEEFLAGGGNADHFRLLDADGDGVVTAEELQVIDAILAQQKAVEAASAKTVVEEAAAAKTVVEEAAAAKTVVEEAAAAKTVVEEAAAAKTVAVEAAGFECEVCGRVFEGMDDAEVCEATCEETEEQICAFHGMSKQAQKEKPKPPTTLSNLGALCGEASASIEEEDGWSTMRKPCKKVGNDDRCAVPKDAYVDHDWSEDDECHDDTYCNVKSGGNAKGKHNNTFMAARARNSQIAKRNAQRGGSKR